MYTLAPKGQLIKNITMTGNESKMTEVSKLHQDMVSSLLVKEISLNSCNVDNNYSSTTSLPN